MCQLRGQSERRHQQTGHAHPLHGQTGAVGCEGLNVLSIFDGLSGGQIALERLGIKVDRYFASEIDKYALQVTKNNYPNTIQLGDVRNVKASNLPKIDLILAGSPCQGFSFAGKGLNFNDERSKLFFEFVRLLKECQAINPNLYFLLENVKMKAEYEIIISKYVGVWPIEINSALVSAQNRRRLYWTNIKAEPFTLFGDLRTTTIKQPKDKGLILRHLLELEVDEKYHLSDAALKRLHRKKYSVPKINPEKAGAINTKNNSGQLSFDSGTTLIWLGTIGEKDSKSNRVYSPKGKACTICASGGGYGAKTGMYEIKKGLVRRLTPKEVERCFTISDSYTEGVSDTQRYKMLGNGWTVDVIAYILGHMNLTPESLPTHGRSSING